MKTVTEACRTVPLRPLLTAFLPAAAAFLLTGGALDGLYSPWSLAAVSAAGVSWPGLSALLGAGLGAFLFLDFQAGLRHTAAAILIFCASTAFCTTRLYRRPRFRPAAAVVMTLLVQSAYLLQRQPRQWALCAAALTILYAAAALLPALSDGTAAPEVRRQAAFVAAVGLSLTAYGWDLSGFRIGGALAAAVLLTAARTAPPAAAAAMGAVTGLMLDLYAGHTVLLTAALCAAAAAAAVPRRRLLPPVLFCLAASGVYLLLDGPDPLPLLFQNIAGAGLFLLLPDRLLPSLAKQPPAAPQEPPPAAEVTAAAAFRAVYDSFFADAAPPRPENPAVLFDRAAEQVCAGCLLQRDCWQTHYNDTYNAFNDACPHLLHRGDACAADFPLHFSSRCLHFPQLLEALNGQLRQYLLRRAHQLQLAEAYEVARQQYAQMSEVLSSGVPVSAAIQTHFSCGIASALRPREGETLCGDQAAAFAVGGVSYLLLSDGMGSGEEAHREAAMTVRLLRQFLQAGVDPLPALKTLNTALLLRCREGAGFTTIDLLRLDRADGGAALYKYGAAPSYLKKGGRVTRYTGGVLPAGLESAAGQPEAIRFQLPPEGWFVMVSDGVTGGDGDEWLQDLLAGWDAGSPHELARRILTVSADHGGLSDDCAVLVLHRPRGEENGKTQV